MESQFKIGQKVICIDPKRKDITSCRLTNGEIYTIRCITKSVMYDFFILWFEERLEGEYDIYFKSYIIVPDNLFEI